MESSAAGQLANDTVIAENLRRLAALRPDVPVLSLYLDLDPSEFGTQPARASAYTSLLDEAAKRVDAYDTDHDGRRSLREAVERARSFFDDYRPERAHGVAIFAAPAAGLFETYSLPRAPRTSITIDAAPAIAPLIAAIDTRDWLIVLVDAQHARFLHGNSDRIEELEHERVHIPGQHERQSTSDHQRWVEHNIDAHLKDAAAAVDRRLGSGRLDRLVIGGPPEIATRFEQILSNPAREKLAGRIDVEVADTIPDDIRTAVAGCFEDDERRHERELLDRLAERLGRGERAVAGVDGVLGILEMAGVETLLYDTRPEGPDPDVLERAIESAVTQAAEIAPLRHHEDALTEHDHLAALTRF